MAGRRRPGLTIAVAATVALSFAAGGSASETQGIDVRAKVSFVKRGFEYRHVQVRITRNGRTWTSQGLGTVYSNRPRVTVRDLDVDGEPEVLLDTYTGGAHCCSVVYAFRYLPGSRRYAKTYHVFGNVGYSVKNVDGRDNVEFVTKDDRFAYVFTAFAASFFPIQIFQFTGGRFVDVTRNFPGLIESDANELLSEYERMRRERGDVRGVLAAWVADQYLLGRADAAWARLEAAYRRRELGPKNDLTGWPQGRSYFKLLRSTLLKLGYG